MARPAPDPDLVVEAYRLTLPEEQGGEGLSPRQVAVRLGIALSTAQNYIRQAAEVVPHLGAHRVAKQQGDMMTRLIATLFDAYDIASLHRPETKDDDHKPWLEVSKFAADREAQLARLLGLDAPKSVQIVDDSERTKPDPAVMDALDRALRRSEQDTRALRAGKPGVIEG